LNINYNKEFETLINSFKMNDNTNILNDKNRPFLLINADNILGVNEIEGIKIETKSIENGVRVKVIVEKGTKLNKSIYMCFGVTHKKGIQNIISEYILEEGSEAHILTHCSFPRAEDIVHKMESTIYLKKDAILSYKEIHYHGDDARIKVDSRTRAYLDEEANYFSEFKLVQGRVGKLDLDYEVELGKNSITEMISKVYGKKDDKIRIKETIFLNKEGSRGIAKTRVFASDETVSEVIGQAFGNAPNVKGHIDCLEVVKGNAEVSAIPIIKVNNDLAELSHEASIGRINEKQLETLIARGLSEDEATDLIVNGMLK
jgi:uncharacterized protein